jgi:Arc/MetJ family transcription regulator
VAVTKISVEVDPDKLDRAKRILGTETVRDTIDAALREVIRIDSVRRLVDLAEQGTFSTLLAPDAEQRLWA